MNNVIKNKLNIDITFLSIMILSKVEFLLKLIVRNNKNQME